jgi:signal transduction histidine kinase
MKFWQKAFLCTVFVFLIAFDAATFLLVEKGYALSTKNTYIAAETERYVIKRSLYERILSIADLYTELNAANLKMYIDPYGSYYQNQNIYMELYLDETPVYSNFPHTLDTRPELEVDQGEKSTMERSVEDTLYLFITGYLDEPYSNLKFVYIKNIQNLADYRKEMARNAVIISVIVTFLLSLLIILMLLKLTAPLRKLNKTAKEMAEGNYHKRVEINSKDEIGEFAENFNAMAISVESHIQKLSDLTEERQRFIDNLAHEMRTPITAIIGYGEYLKCANCSEEERVKAVDYIIRQSERLKNMAEKLLELANLEKAAIRFENVDIEKITESAENTLAQSIREKKIDIKKDIRSRFVKGDPDLLESLLLNIMENAIRAIKEEGTVEIKSMEEKGTFLLSVSDNGIGMKEEELTKIFEPFYRVDKSRSRAFGGTGLGLALCKRICDLHNARMNISSQEGTGTTVEIKFTSPLQPDDDSVK